MGHTKRALSELLYYPFPLVNWFDPVLPQLTRELRSGPADPYWFAHQTEAYEVALYVGTLPLIFAFLAMWARPAGRSTLPWKVVIPICFALATMMVWWPEGYLELVKLPGLGYFRVPARYTLLCSFGLAVLAAEGFDLTISRRRFRAGLGSAIGFAVLAVVAAAFWANRPEVHLRPLLGGVPGDFLWCAWPGVARSRPCWDGAAAALAPGHRLSSRPWSLASCSTAGRPNGARP